MHFSTRRRTGNYLLLGKNIHDNEFSISISDGDYPFTTSINLTFPEGYTCDTKDTWLELRYFTDWPARSQEPFGCVGFAQLSDECGMGIWRGRIAFIDGGEGAGTGIRVPKQDSQAALMVCTGFPQVSQCIMRLRLQLGNMPAPPDGRTLNIRLGVSDKLPASLLEDSGYPSAVEQLTPVQRKAIADFTSEIGDPRFSNMLIKHQLPVSPVVRRVLTPDDGELGFCLPNINAFSWYLIPAELNVIRTYTTPKFDGIRLIEPGETTIDFGANLGFHSIAMAHLVGNLGSVTAFELFPSMNAVIRLNGALNGQTWLDVADGGVGENSSEMRIAAHSMVLTEDDASEQVNVKIWSPDEYMSDRDVDFFKMDVDGYELFALRGSQRILSQRPKYHIEIHEPLFQRFGYDLNDILDLLPDEYIWWYFDQRQSEVRVERKQDIHMKGYGAITGIPRELIGRIPA